MSALSFLVEDLFTANWSEFIAELMDEKGGVPDTIYCGDPGLFKDGWKIKLFECNLQRVVMTTRLYRI